MCNTLNRFKENCPRQLDSLPCESCPLALERINAIKADGTKKKRKENEPKNGCDWFIASAEYNYCFWLYNKFLESEPATDREICDMLMIDKQTLESTFNSAIDKLKSIKDSQLIKDLIESVAVIAEQSGLDYTTYMPSEFKEAIRTIEESDNQDLPPEKPKTKIKHPTGLPLHRDGKKVDLFGLYSRKKPPKPEKKDDKKKKDNKE